MTDRELAYYVMGCPSYKQTTEGWSRNKWLSETLLPVFDKFQENKLANNIYYFKHNMLNDFSSSLKKVNKEKLKEYREYMESCVSNYYDIFKSKWYNTYKVISLSRKYQKDDINGNIDLIIKTSYGTTFFNYNFFVNMSSFHADIQYTATRLQIAGRCFELMGRAPDLLGMIVFTKNKAFRMYFKYISQPYEEYLKIHNENLEPIKKRYCWLCSTCTESKCAPWKTQDKILL